MPNTHTKATKFEILSYTYTVKDSARIHSSEPAIEESPSEQSHNIVEENILPINNNVIQTINYQRSSGGLRI